MLKLGCNLLGFYVEDVADRGYLCDDGVVRDWAYIVHSNHGVYFKTEVDAMIAKSAYENGGCRAVVLVINAKVPKDVVVVVSIVPVTNTKVGDYVVIHEIKKIGYGFDAVQQRLYYVGSIHRVTEVSTQGVTLEGNTFLVFRHDEVRKTA